MTLIYQWKTEVINKILTNALGQFLSIFKAQSWLIMGENINTPLGLCFHRYKSL